MATQNQQFEAVRRRRSAARSEVSSSRQAPADRVVRKLRQSDRGHAQSKAKRPRSPRDTIFFSLTGGGRKKSTPTFEYVRITQFTIFKKRERNEKRKRVFLGSNFELDIQRRRRDSAGSPSRGGSPPSEVNAVVCGRETPDAGGLRVATICTRQSQKQFVSQGSAAHSSSQSRSSFSCARSSFKRACLCHFKA